MAICLSPSPSWCQVNANRTMSEHSCPSHVGLSRGSGHFTFYHSIYYAMVSQAVAAGELPPRRPYKQATAAPDSLASPSLSIQTPKVYQLSGCMALLQTPPTFSLGPIILLTRRRSAPVRPGRVSISTSLQSFHLIYVDHELWHLTLSRKVPFVGRNVGRFDDG